MVVLGLKASILVKFCNPSVNTLHCVVTKHKGVKES